VLTGWHLPSRKKRKRQGLKPYPFLPLALCLSAGYGKSGCRTTNERQPMVSCPEKKARRVGGRQGVTWCSDILHIPKIFPHINIT